MFVLLFLYIFIVNFGYSPKMEGKLLKLGWIGTGVMGFSMCKHLIGAGYELLVYNRTRSKTDGLI